MQKKRSFLVSMSVGCALLVGNAGCGDVETFDLKPGSIDPHSVDPDHACFDGSEIELIRYSSACGTMSESLSSVVRDGLVFSAEEVQGLASPCEDGPTPGIDVLFDMASHSMLLDFSQVPQGDRFPEAAFDGYMFNVAIEERNGLLLALTIDRALSTLQLEESDIEWDRSHIEVLKQGYFVGDKVLRPALVRVAK